MSYDIHVAEDSQQPKTCPYCQQTIRPGQSAVACQSCGVAHHQGCWEENGGCAAWGCDSQAYTALPEQSLPPTPQIESIQLNIPHISLTEGDLPDTPHIVLDEADLPPSPPPPAPEQPRATCVYCHEEIKPGERAVACQKCGTPYHLNCWNETNRCGMLGCNHRQSVAHHPGRSDIQIGQSSIDSPPDKKSIWEKIKGFFK